jgi:hypothetical protein
MAVDPGFAPSAARLSPCLLLSATAAIACQRATVPDGGHTGRIVSERVGACETLLGELSMLDASAANEAELLAAMTTADTTGAECGQILINDAQSPVELIIARNRARQFELVGRTFEAALSFRFDGRAFYCDIVRESFQMLLADQVDVETGLQEFNGLTEEETRTLEQLRDLNLEALDVLFQATERFCDFD